MDTSRSRVAGLVSTALAIVVLGAGCASSGGHQTGSATTGPGSTTAPTATTVPASGATATTRPHAGSTATRGDLAALKQQLDAAGSSLGAAGAAIAQSDPNQTKNEEGSAP